MFTAIATVAEHCLKPGSVISPVSNLYFEKWFGAHYSAIVEPPRTQQCAVHESQHLLTAPDCVIIEATTTEPNNESSIRATRYICDAVVCALPLGVLKSDGGGPRFVPELPENKSRAIEELQYGVVRCRHPNVYSWQWMLGGSYALT